MLHIKFASMFSKFPYLQYSKSCERRKLVKQALKKLEDMFNMLLLHIKLEAFNPFGMIQAFRNRFGIA